MTIKRVRHALLPALALLAAIGCPADTTAPVAAKLAFSVQPTAATPGQALSPTIQVEIQDDAGARVADAQNAITLALGTSSSGALLGGTTTANAASGLATFTGLSVDRAATGLTLVASAGGLTSATSTAFSISLAPGAFTQVSGGEAHTCGLTAAGAIYCWGVNTSGQLGDGTTIQRLARVLVTGGLTFTAVSTGLNHTCGLTAAGAYCWGDNSAGALGDGTFTSRSSPVLVAAPTGVTFASISASKYHTCAVAAAGAAYCWGSNTAGEIGDGTSSGVQVTPVLVTGSVSFAGVIAGFGYHTCGITAAHVAYCWGQNMFGQIGDGTTANYSSPTLVPAPTGMTFSGVSAGGLYTCGATISGAAYCWGLNSSGQLGDGTGSNRLSPRLVAAPMGVSFARVSAGNAQTCGLTAAGIAYCWGENFNGQVGDGTTTGRTNPVLVGGSLTFAAVSSGFHHVCAVTYAGAVYCWGANANGQLGDGTTTDQSAPTRVLP